MNKVILLGRLTKDPELRTTPTGVSVCRFSVAVNRRFAKEGQQTADFINCVAWRQNAEFLAKYFTKGRMLAVVGTLQTRNYDKDGQTHYVTEVIADEVYFAGDNKAQYTFDQPQVELSDVAVPIPNDDDLPF